jgi:hypothetical protein
MNVGFLSPSTLLLSSLENMRPRTKKNVCQYKNVKADVCFCLTSCKEVANLFHTVPLRDLERCRF